MDPRFRRALWIALAVNLAMFLVEVVGGLHAGSVSLLADAVDFAGDASNYAISLAVLSMAAAWRSRAALVKGLSMGAYGIGVLAFAGHRALAGTPPEAIEHALAWIDGRGGSAEYLRSGGLTEFELTALRERLTA